jgi:hypothetical protein
MGKQTGPGGARGSAGSASVGPGRRQSRTDLVVLQTRLFRTVTTMFPPSPRRSNCATFHPGFQKWFIDCVNEIILIKLCEMHRLFNFVGYHSISFKIIPKVYITI